ncbi:MULTISPECIES: GMC family oxidoreductase [Alphaproteobacteria]|uniref:Dehydrogenase n=2 Tax=Alphaproteobacteria TaxID=28211 RepID=A0A512HNM8_9HYPH|nr:MULTISPECIES: GMC family oxidoreductase N-terminal domain-containing protein [Alphaproteobacteria]GEO87058.1 dehydrogenase [Ciceribacter naphthalenivorans]GLR23156.1 dehydrogenase [Ciceribacter naphthalenivorans]GLT06012.1 dehydrogenase [Sphingomonas psychrolutea]
MSELTFDYIVIGAGSAGCVIANRLSADPSVRVALVEAGESYTRFPLNLKVKLPFGNIFLLPDARYNWNDEFIASDANPDRRIPCPRGRIVGGCSAVNGTVYMRGHASDYDEWQAQGNEGWSYEDVLPAFKAHENWKLDVNGEFHGRGGELNVATVPSPNAISAALIDGGRETGHEATRDFNGPSQDGFGLFSVNQRNGMRMSSAEAFLRPAKGRRNLTLLDGALVERINVENGRATGITVVRQGKRQTIRAAQEIVLSAGTINSPHLLMLSGIGPASELNRHGIEVVADLPGVGRNLQDHPAVGVAVEDTSGHTLALSWKTLPKLTAQALRYILTRKGVFASNVAEVGGFLRSRPGLNRPDVQVTFLMGLKTAAALIPRQHGFVALVNICRPESRGRLELRSASPLDRPKLTANFLDNQNDVDTLVRGIREVRRVIRSTAMKPYAGKELLPGDQVTGDADLEAYVRSTVATVYHPVGTCKMGPASDPMAVVDPQLRVRGIAGLRVADASIMPSIVAGNTSAPAMMIGERAAAFILGERKIDRRAA